MSFVYFTSAQTVKIGAQLWMVKNLDVSTFRNGDSIPEAKTAEEWLAFGAQGKPAWCYYNNDAAYGIKYGKLYNGHAVNDMRGLAPDGYHIPSTEEWEKLREYSAGDRGLLKAGLGLKSAKGWNGYFQYGEQIVSSKGTNSTGFSGLPGGFRQKAEFIDYGFGEGLEYFPEFQLMGDEGRWWSSTKTTNSRNYHEYNDYFTLRNSYTFSHHYKLRFYGFSVRCIKD